jgi:hypothetical protein
MISSTQLLPVREFYSCHSRCHTAVAGLIDGMFDNIPYASYNREYVCLDGTRTELIGTIMDWVEGADGTSVLWLSGLAGTGKSTISHSI